MSFKEYWCKVPASQASDIVRRLEDAHIRSYNTSIYKSHDAILNCEESTVELVLFDGHMKYASSHQEEVEHLDAELEVSYDKMVEYLMYLASE